MRSELERTKVALKHAMNGLAFAGRTSTIAECESILNPPPAMEEVEETVGWVNVYRRSSGAKYLGEMEIDKDNADYFQTNNGDPKVGCQEIKIKVTRPVPQKVERSVTIPCCIDGLGDIFHGEDTDDYPMKDHEETFGKTGTLTFSWTEE